MPPKLNDNAASTASDTVGMDRNALLESELVTAVLRSRLGRYQEAGERLAVENFSLADEVARQKLTLQDINEFLTNELKARSIAAAQLEERSAQLTVRLAEVQKEAQAEVARVKAEAAAEVLAASQRATAGAEAGTTEPDGCDTAAQKAHLERTVAELRAALSAQDKDMENRLSDLERRHLQEKEKMRKEAAEKIRETKMAMAKLADQHLESSTKRTLVENDAMAMEVAYHTAQSHDLVAANSMLRSDVGELKRQLAIANHTVHSTAHKNVLLQQTIKSILTCLREEARHNAEAAVMAAQQQQQHNSAGDSTGGMQPVCAALQAPAHTRQQGCCVAEQHQDSAHAQQQQRQGEVDGCEVVVPGGIQRGQQQQQGESDGREVVVPGGLQSGHEVFVSVDALPEHSRCHQLPLGMAPDAAAVLGQLEGRVLLLTDQLSAAKQAFAAALQGCLPADLHTRCAITCSWRPAPVGAPADVTPTCPPAGVEALQAAQVSRTPGGGSSPQPTGRISPVVQQQQHQHQRWGRRKHVLSGDPCSSCWVCGASTQVGAMEAALQDGVAAFVLYCVQHLRRASSSSKQQPTAGPSGAPLSAAASSSRANKQQSTAGVKAGGRGSPSPTLTAVAVPGTTSKGWPPAAAAAVGANGSSSRTATFPAAAGAVGASCTACCKTPGSGAGNAAAATCSSSWEELARVLLEQLHQYSRQVVLPYQGLTVIFDKDEPQGDGPALLSSPAIPQGHVAGPGVVGVGASSDASVPQWPAVPLSDVLGRQQRPTELYGAAQHTAEECTTNLQLPPLPSLLSKAQGRSPDMSAMATAAAAGACLNRGGPLTRSPVPDRDGLFNAVLSELRPWGGAAVCVSSSTNSPLTSPGSSEKCGGPSSPTRAAAGQMPASAIRRSKTPPLPATIKRAAQG